MKILITGDLVINQSYNGSNINQNVIDLFKQSDLNIVNLEAPVTTSTSKILKTGPHLKAEEQSILEALKILEVDVVTLANNHVLDFDEKGVEDTLDFCDKNNFQTVGAGMNLEEASKTLFLDTSEGKIAVVNFAENEWASASENTAGANPMDIIDNANQIKKAKQNADYVFVIVHGGHEYYNLPSPRMQKQYRFYAEQGADIVVGHHTHCFSGMETYKNKPIYYSLGNFLFTKPSKFEEWYKGIVLEVEIDGGVLKTTPLFVKQCEETFKLSFVCDEELKEIKNFFLDYSNIITNRRELISHWEKLIGEKSKLYENYWSPLSFIKNKYLKAVLSKIGFNGSNKHGKALHLNLLRCEAHADLSKEIILKYLTKK